MSQPLDGTRRLLETTDPDVVNQYLRFGWKLINQHLVEGTLDHPARVRFVLASIRTLEETKELVTLHDTATVNTYLQLGWRLIDKYVTTAAEERRQETMHFVLAWQTEGKPVKPEDEPADKTHGSSDEYSDGIGFEPHY